MLLPGVHRSGAAQETSAGRSPSVGARRKRPLHLTIGSDEEVAGDDMNSPASANHNKYVEGEH